MRLRTIRYPRLKATLAVHPRPSYVVAAEAGMTAQVLSGIVSGRCEPTEAHRRRIAEVLGVDETELFEDE